MTYSTSDKTRPNILITGGSGFLGSRIVEEFLDENCPIKVGLVRVIDCNPFKGKFIDQIEFIQADIRDFDAVVRACKDIDIVIHSAAIIDWGTKSEEEVLAVNVGGTENIIKACHDNNIENLVVTSSLDAVFTGKPLRNIDESQPYPESHHTVYCKSKKLTEIVSIKANNEDLKVVVLRPSDIYGENDPYHIDSLVDMAKTGFYVRLGNGRSKCQHVYVGNMAHAHILAADALWKGNIKVNGQVYFITDGEASNFFKFFDQIVAGAGYKIFPKNLWLPKGVAYTIATISEGIAFLARPFKRYNPKFSRFAVTYTCTDFTFTSDKAEEDFGFKAKYSLEEAISKTTTWYKKKS
ncbi:MAG: NAD-dependent epimerase/dehydratase family protein [Chitinophagales bacterium]|nr:NAD-dependent epimerase/dehydratase family protein [Chitinophagales bacterium]